MKYNFQIASDKVAELSYKSLTNLVTWRGDDTKNIIAERLARYPQFQVDLVFLKAVII